MQLDELIASLKKSGFRITPVRKQILSLFLTIEHPLTVSEILMSISVNKTTIYREVETLLQNNYIVEINLGDGKKRYELSQAGHHHHLVCVSCRSIQELDIADDFRKEEQRIRASRNFQVQRHSLEFFGICSQCSN